MMIRRIMVVGAGTMGSAIAQVMAQAGFAVVMRDVAESFVRRGLSAVTKNLSRQVEKGKLDSAEAAAVEARIQGIVDFQDAGDIDLVIEAVVEEIEAKKKLFQELDEILKPQAIIASNTSSISITALASMTKRPDKVIGMHFFNPVQVMQLIEIIKGAGTSEETCTALMELGQKIGKTPIRVEEAPGFAVNRILVPMINEAAFLLMEGVASAADLDTAMKLGANHPIGPLALGDLIGLDVCLAVMEVLHSELGDDKYRPCPLLRKMVRAGYLGRKSGQGFFSYK